MAACQDKCERCGWGEYKEVLEVHHINQRKRDGRRENLKLLCPNCHEIVHFLEQSGRYAKDRYKKAQKVQDDFLAQQT